jgi:DNA-binding GntR family transcriptional regulator
VSAPLERTSTGDALAAALRPRILDGDLPAGARLREQELSDEYEVARHTLRSTLRELEREGLVRIEPNRGARVASLETADLDALADLRIALEVEAARLALEHGDGLLPDDVHRAADRLAAVCNRRRPAWSAVVDAHEELHARIVAAAGSPRIEAAHRALAGELRLFIAQLRPAWSLERMAADHLELVEALESEHGPEALRPHIRESTAALRERERERERERAT